MARDAAAKAMLGALLPEGILILENVSNLSRLPALSVFMALPLNIHGGSGSPVRAVAFAPRSG